jgi:hypothetical protein
VEYTILSAPCHNSAKSCTQGGSSARAFTVYQLSIVSYTRRPKR